MPSPEVVAAAVARNTRRLRTARGWSLDQFASRSGVSKGMLVHLEQARTNPSLGTLCKVAETLGVTLAALVEADEQAPAVRVVGPTEVVRLWSEANGSAGDLLVGLDESVHVELWHWRLVPGERHPSEAHRAGTRELIHVLEGELTLEVDAAQHAVAAGGAALFEADHDHAYRNDGEGDVRLVMVVLQPDADLDEWTAARPTDVGEITG